MNLRNVPTILVPFIYGGLGYLLFYAFMALQVIVLVGLILYFINKVWNKILN